MSFPEWPGFHGLRIVLFWVVLVFVVFGWRYYWGVTRAVADDAVRPTFDVTTPLLVAVGPPLLLAIGYGVYRRLSRKP